MKVINFYKYRISAFIFSFLLIININTLTLEKISLFSNFDISFTKINLFLIYVILPSLIFLFLQSILLKYIDFLWATSISVLSIISYAGYDFKKFIFDIIFNYSNVQNLTPKKIILEPCGKNTAPAVTIASLIALQDYDNVNVLVLSADHVIQHIENFHEALNKGFE